MATVFNFVNDSASQCGLPASTVNLTAPGWPWPSAAAAENFVSQGEKTICSPGNALTVFVRRVHEKTVSCPIVGQSGAFTCGC